MKSEKTLEELKAESLEAYSRFYPVIAALATGIIPITEESHQLIRGCLSYVAGDICIHESNKQQARERN